VHRSAADLAQLHPGAGEPALPESNETKPLSPDWVRGFVRNEGMRAITARRLILAGTSWVRTQGLTLLSHRVTFSRLAPVSQCVATRPPATGYRAVTTVTGRWNFRSTL
jgi:hypothetical protein